MYVIVIKTPANSGSGKMVNTYFVGFTMIDNVRAIEWDEDITFARKFTSKLAAKKVRSLLVMFKGSEEAKIRFQNLFSKN